MKFNTKLLDPEALVQDNPGVSNCMVFNFNDVSSQLHLEVVVAHYLSRIKYYDNPFQD